MLSLRLHSKHHKYIFLFGLSLMVIGLPFSKVLMSISQFVLLGNWLWEGNLKNKLKIFSHNKAALILASLPLLYLAGLIHSNDLDYALNDIRIKLPLLVLPLVLSSSSPLDSRKFSFLMNLFSISVIVASFFSMAAYFGYSWKTINNLRDISVFISHIRFALLICIAILFLFYSSIKNDLKWMKYLQFTGGLWLLFFLFFLESMTGLLALTVAVLTIALIYSLRQRSLTVKYFFAGILLLVPILFFSFLYREVENFYHVKPVDFSNLEEFSKKGEKYIHSPARKNFENGNLVYIYYAPLELEQAWNALSSIKFTEKDKRGQIISLTLMRFLTSKNLRKDAEALQYLSENEIRAIENGDGNVLYLERGFRTRVHQIIWEINNYYEGENPQGNSITQRVEFWKAASNAIRQNPVFGTGTGDLQKELNDQFSSMKTLLEPQYWLKPHNQFITITVAFGGAGLAWFLIFLLIPMAVQKSWGDFFYTTFFVIATLSMFSEDTLDTQAGITFFTFFSCLFLFRKKMSDEIL